MIGWTFPFKGVPVQMIGVLLSGGLLLFGHEQNNFAVISGGHHPTSDGVETRVTP
jgi:hypothetical protein